MKIGSCSLCGEEIFERDEYTLCRQVVGWEGKRRGGGHHALKIRRETGAIAHGDCVDRENRKFKAGLPSTQAGLF